MIRIHEILEKTGAFLSASDQALIQKAYVFSAAAHAGQVRLSGESYLSHPLEVANILAGHDLDAYTITAGLLHDTVEDSGVTVKEVKEQFGEEVAAIVDGVTKIGKMSFTSKEEAQAENIRKMILAMAEDIRVILVKLADRLHNMRTLEFQKSFKQQLVGQETLDIYAPLANRLGLYNIKTELEDLALKYLKPDVYQQIAKGVQAHQSAGDAYIEKVIALISGLLSKNDIPFEVFGRLKHIYSIYHKMLQQSLDLDHIYDLIAFRVVVPGIRDCYAVLGLIHSIWKPVPGRFKDYISMPKANMYQSLHTTVIGPDGERIEIQIRTQEMHRLAEYGVAAHWSYKEGSKISAKDVGRFSWLRQILDWQRELKDPREFMTSLRFDLFQDEVYVFTPRGEVKELPEGATPVDFAYLIHTEVGDRCAGAKVNGRLVPLQTQLKNGDSVEIITEQGKNPSRDWLKFVKTAKARTRIKHWIRTEERERSIGLAREMLEKEGRKAGVNFTKLLKKGDLEPIAKEFSFRAVDDLLSAVGYARITPQQILNRLQPKEEKKPKPEPTAAEVRKEVAEIESAKGRAEQKSRGEGVRVKGVDDVLVQFARCCNPVPGDAIVGYISRGRGVTVHTSNCPNVQLFEPERLLNVSWEGEKEKSFPTVIKILCRNLSGVLSEIASILAEEKVNIDSGTFRSIIDGTSEMVFTVEVFDTAHLYRAIDKLSGIEAVMEVSRMDPRQDKLRLSETKSTQ
jgi:GTP diphosphokinase / guanosine-3',5'-bis(diphosphate) 3'-diphosphatase